jgi:hypothetical protein
MDQHMRMTDSLPVAFTVSNVQKQETKCLHRYNWTTRVYGQLLFRQAAWDATLLHPFLYVVDLKCALNFGEAQGVRALISPNVVIRQLTPYQPTGICV